MKTCALLLSLLLTLVGRPSWAEGEDAPVPDRRREFDVRIQALDAERAEISTKGPKTATVAGLGMLVVGGITFGAGMGSRPDQANEGDTPVGAIIAGISLLGIGAITALVGGLIWDARVDRRNEIDAERESLIEERDGLANALSRLELRSAYRSGTRFVTLGVRF